MAPSQTAEPRKSYPGNITEVDNAEATESTGLLNGQEQEQDAEAPGQAPAPHRRWSGLDDFQGLHWTRRPSVVWLFLPYIVFTLAFGGIIVPKLNLILDLVCKRYMTDQELVDPSMTFLPVVLGGENPQCKIPEVARATTSFITVMTTCTGVLSCIVAPKLGHLSDRYGRTKFMALASLGGILSEAITIFAAKFPETVDYRWLVLASIFDGVTGSFTAGSVLTQAYASDCTPPHKRAVYMGYIHACLFSGVAFGPLLAGYFVKWTGSLLSIFYVVLGCHIFYMLFIGFVVPDSLSKRKRQIAQSKWDYELMTSQVDGSWWILLAKQNPLQPLKVLWPRGRGTSLRLRLNIVLLALNDFIMLGTAMAAGPVILLYSELIFKWGNFEASRFMSAISMIRVIGLMGIFPIINYVFRMRPAQRRLRESGIKQNERNSGMDRVDLFVIRIALISDVCGYVGYLCSRSPAWFVISGMVTALGGMGGATVQASITKHVPSERVGQTLGAVGLLQALARVIAPIVLNGVFYWTVGKFDQAIFVLMAALFSTALLSTAALKLYTHWDEDAHEEEEPLISSESAFRGVIDNLPVDQDQIIVP